MSCPNFIGQTVLITGASRGIGAAAAEHFATLGAQVVLTARSEAELAKLAEKIGSKSLAIACDIADFAQVQAAVDQTVARFGRLDIVVNNAVMAPSFQHPIGRTGRNIEDRPALLCRHDRQGRLHHVKDTFNIHINHPVPIGGFEIRRLGPGD